MHSGTGVGVAWGGMTLHCSGLSTNTNSANSNGRLTARLKAFHHRSRVARGRGGGKVGEAGMDARAVRVRVARATLQHCGPPTA